MRLIRSASLSCYDNTYYLLSNGFHSYVCSHKNSYQFKTVVILEIGLQHPEIGCHIDYQNC